MRRAHARFAAGFAWRACLLAVAILTAGPLQAIVNYSNSYRSPRNPERPIRKSTTLIVLHTTEAPANSSLNKLSDRGEAHYCVVENGTVYRIVDRDREAFHAGRSMWNSKSNVDEFSVGIEVVGYHDKQMPLAQLSALRELVLELKTLYKIDDAHVLCHSHVAYGAPNKWHKRSHRGRKQCGMLFAMPSVRSKLGLTQRPAFDPDVKAKRLVQADPYLDSVLYGSTDTFRGVYGVGKIAGVSPTAASTPPKREPSALEKLEALLRGLGGGTVEKTPPVPANSPVRTEIKTTKPAEKPQLKAAPAKAKGAAAAGKKTAAKSSSKATVPAGKGKPDEDGVKELGVDGKTLYEIAGNEAAKAYVIIVRPDGTFCRGSELTRAAAAKLPTGTKVLLGYAVGGPIAKGKGPSSICGAAWRAKTTYYLLNKKLVPGNVVDDRKLSPGTYVFYRN